MTNDSAKLISHLIRIIREHQLFQPNDTLIVAISGGADSTALLDLLVSLPDYNLHLIAAHLNHCLRGSESDADEEFCRALAAKYGIPFEICRVDVKGLALRESLNLEDAARKARIQFLDGICVKYGAAAVALAHHADDQAETVLMRLLRGSGMTGLSGMAYRNDRGYVRPLLDISRTEIENYLRERGMTWREDASNKDTTYLRNRIRHDLLPLLETYNPAIRAGLASTAELIAGDEALLTELTETAFSGAFRSEGDKIVTSIAQVRSLHPALQRRIFRQAFKQVAGTLGGLSQRHISSICDLLDSGRPNLLLTLPHSVTLLREYDRLTWSRQDVPRSRQSTDCAGIFELTIPATGSYPLPDGTTILIKVAETKPFPAASTTLCLDLAEFPFPWHVRTFRAGDRMQPFGMQGRKKVKDIFIDRKIPTAERRCIPLLFCGEELIWIVGVFVSELCRIDNQSSHLLHLVMQTSDDSCE